MSTVLGFAGGDDFYHGGQIYANPKDSSLFFPLASQLDVYFPPRKRCRVTAPFVFDVEILPQKQLVSIETLPDECLFEILRRLSGGQERSASACVSKRWLSLLSNIRGNEISSNKNGQSVEHENDVENLDGDQVEDDRFLSRSLEGKMATDIRLAAISVGTASRGGLSKLSIRGCNSDRTVTDIGLRAIARGCPSLKDLSLWNISTISDVGLIEISGSCHQLEKLDLCNCPAISDDTLIAIAKNCPGLSELSVDSCPKIGNGSLQAIGQSCPNLRTITIKDCSLVGDNGISSLFSSRSSVLTNVKLQGLNISDVSLAVIGHYGLAVTRLVLNGLPNVSERGFWVMGKGLGLQKLNALTITSCQGVTDIGLESVGKGCPNLKHLHLTHCASLTDNGIVSLAKAAVSLKSIHLRECHQISQLGLFGFLVNCGPTLSALYLVNCSGLKDVAFKLPVVSSRSSLESLSVRNCAGFGDMGLASVGKLCRGLLNVELCGLVGITDDGFVPLLESCEGGLAKIDLSGCVNITDKTVLSIAEQHGWTLEVLNLDGCQRLTDTSLLAIAEHCPLLSDLNVSKCAITDAGVDALARGDQISLQVLSLSGCSSVSNKSLPAFVKLGQSLLGLNIQHCKSISRMAVKLLVDGLWKCHILS